MRRAAARSGGRCSIASSPTGFATCSAGARCAAASWPGCRCAMREDDEEFDPDRAGAESRAEPRAAARARRGDRRARDGGGRIAAAPAAGVPAAQFRGARRQRDGERHGLFGRQREDALFPRAGNTARAAWAKCSKVKVMSQDSNRTMHSKNGRGSCSRRARRASTDARCRGSRRRATRRSTSCSARRGAAGARWCRPARRPPAVLAVVMLRRPARRSRTRARSRRRQRRRRPGTAGRRRRAGFRRRRRRPGVLRMGRG